MASAAESSVAVRTGSPNNPVQEVYGNTGWTLPVPAEEQVPYDQYLSALLDVYCRNDSRAFVALGLGTEEDATLLYNAVLDSEILSMELDSYFGAECPEDLKTDLQTLLAQLLGGARYAVTGCELQADGTYKITIIYEQMIIFEPLMELYMAVVTDMASTWFTDHASFPSDEEMMIHIVAALRDSLRVCLENVKYAAPAIATVTVRPQNGIYMPDLDDIENLENLLFDTNAVLD